MGSNGGGACEAAPPLGWVGGCCRAGCASDGPARSGGAGWFCGSAAGGGCWFWVSDERICALSAAGTESFCCCWVKTTAGVPMLSSSWRALASACLVRTKSIRSSGERAAHSTSPGGIPWSASRPWGGCPSPWPGGGSEVALAVTFLGGMSTAPTKSAFEVVTVADQAPGGTKRWELTYLLQ